jgi:hypothetical protein
VWQRVRRRRFPSLSGLVRFEGVRFEDCQQHQKRNKIKRCFLLSNRIHFYLQTTRADEGVPGKWIHSQHKVVLDMQPLQTPTMLPLRCVRQLRPQIRPPLPVGRYLRRRGSTLSINPTPPYPRMAANCVFACALYF